VPADLLCPQAEKSAFVETKHGYSTVFNHGLHRPAAAHSCYGGQVSQIVQTGNFIVEFEKKPRISRISPIF